MGVRGVVRRERDVRGGVRGVRVVIRGFRLGARGITERVPYKF